jgi:hypothetical protein
MKRTRALLLLSLLCMAGAIRHAGAVTAVNPTGVNVRSTGVTTVFLTFQGTAGQAAVDAFWCGDITVPANTPTPVDPCVPGTVFGHLPLRNDLSAGSGTGGFANTTDIMTIPASVARRAYQDALAGRASQFFYVRKFVNGAGVEEFIAVTCRMAGGGARVPLALTNVDIYFDAKQGRRPVYFLAAGQKPPAIGAIIHYNGGGRFKGRWEVVKPGDLDPEFEDLLTEASLPVERRGLQRRYEVLSRFDVFLQPTGRTVLPGPDPGLIPTGADGPYKILLRVEATEDRESDSNTLAGTVFSGGVAGFPMPVLRYYVGSGEELESIRQALVRQDLALLLPISAAQHPPGRPLNFSWVDIAGADLYRLEIEQDGQRPFSAILKPGVSSYTLPPFVELEPGVQLRWRVSAMNAQGGTVARSDWRVVVIGAD